MIHGQHFLDSWYIYVLFYLYNFNVYYKLFDNHLKDLRKVFLKLREVGLKLKIKEAFVF